MLTEDMKLIHQAALEMRNAMAALTERVECGEITQADLQREMEQATVGLDELTRAIGTAAGLEYEGPVRAARRPLAEMAVEASETR
jgi:hypothetical protein